MHYTYYSCISKLAWFKKEILLRRIVWLRYVFDLNFDLTS